MARKRRPRTPGTGSIRTRTDTGRIEAAFTIGYNERGNPIRTQRTFATVGEADLWLADMRVRHSKGELRIDTKQTLAERVEDWLASLKPKVRERTLDDYRKTLERYVTLHLGDVPLRDLTPAHVDALMTTLSEAGRSTYMIEKAHRYLSMVLINAVMLELIPRNVARHVRPPKPPPPDHARWSLTEARRALQHCQREDSPIARYVTVGLTTGLRREELLGLRWQDVDTVGRRLRIRQTVVVQGGKALIQEAVKTLTSKADVYVDTLTLDTLEAQREYVEDARGAAKRWEEHDLVFPSTVGTPFAESTLRNRFTALCKAAGVTRIRLYDLRSTHGSILADEDVNPKLVSGRLRHADMAFTFDRYVRTQEAEERQVASLIETLLSPHVTAGVTAERALEAPD